MSENSINLRTFYNLYLVLINLQSFTTISRQFYNEMLIKAFSRLPRKFARIWVFIQLCVPQYTRTCFHKKYFFNANSFHLFFYILFIFLNLCTSKAPQGTKKILKERKNESHAFSMINIFPSWIVCSPVFAAQIDMHKNKHSKSDGKSWSCIHYTIFCFSI